MEKIQKEESDIKREIGNYGTNKNKLQDDISIIEGKKRNIAD